jgi:hypothetical protein
MDELLKELKDLILSLKNKDKMEDPMFQRIWSKKKEELTGQIERLSESELLILDVKYEEWLASLEK